MTSVGNPKIPPLKEAIEKLLTRGEQRQYEAHIRPLVEDGAGQLISTAVFLSAVKSDNG